MFIVLSIGSSIFFIFDYELGIQIFSVNYDTKKLNNWIYLINFKN